MTDAVERHLTSKAKVIVGREVKLGRGRLDLVAYDKNTKVFKIIECKLHSGPTNTAKTFGQALGYFTDLEGLAVEFLDSTSRKLEKMRFGRWWEATDRGREIKVAVYVALTHKACMQPEFPALRAQFPQIGVIRVKPNGSCRNALRRRDGAPNSKGAEALPKTIRL